jgi:hypothetical protein
MNLGRAANATPFVVLMLFGLGVGPSAAVVAQCVTQQGYAFGYSTTISVQVGTGWTDPPPIEEAIAIWNDGCPEMGTRMARTAHGSCPA